MPKIASSDLAQQLADVERRYGIPVESPLALLTAGLRLHGFAVEEVGDLLLSDTKPWITGRGYGPYAWLYSQEGRDLRDASWQHDDVGGRNQEKMLEQMTEANLRDRGRLIDLLGEFYADRKCAIHVRLVVSDMAAGSSMLKSQGADVISLPENEPQRPAWLGRARHEMADFAAFLFSKQ
jgi:hypothetical protein